MRVDPAEESRRVDARLKALNAPSTSARDLVLALLHDRVKQAESFTEWCRERLAMVQRSLFPLNPAPSTPKGLFSWYRNPRQVRQKVREQLVNGAIVALAFVRVHCPNLDIAKICRGLPLRGNQRVNMQGHYDAVRNPAEDVIRQLEWEEDQVLRARGDIP